MCVPRPEDQFRIEYNDKGQAIVPPPPVGQYVSYLPTEEEFIEKQRKQKEWQRLMGPEAIPPEVSPQLRLFLKLIRRRF